MMGIFNRNKKFCNLRKKPVLWEKASCSVIGARRRTKNEIFVTIVLSTPQLLLEVQRCFFFLGFSFLKKENLCSFFFFFFENIWEKNNHIILTFIQIFKNEQPMTALQFTDFKETNRISNCLPCWFDYKICELNPWTPPPSPRRFYWNHKIPNVHNIIKCHRWLGAHQRHQCSFALGGLR